MFDNVNTTIKAKINENNNSSIIESLNEKFYNINLLNNVEKACKELFKYNFDKIKKYGYGYCGWIFPNGTVLDTQYSASHFIYQKRLQEFLKQDIEFLNIGLIRYNIKEGLIEFPFTPITNQQLQVLEEVLEKHFNDCQFKFGGGANFLFADNYKKNKFYIDKYVFDDVYPFDVLYKRNGKDIINLIRTYCNTGKLDL